MSQSPNPADSQALLQSMLQKLKLQSEREGQGHRHTLGPENSSPGTNGIPSNKVRSPAADSNFSFKFSHLQQPGHGGGVDRGFISFPSQKDNSVGDTGDSRVMGQATQPAIAPTVTGQLFPTTSLKDASFERTDSEKWSFGNSAMKRSLPPNTDAAQSMGVNENQEQDFKPKVYLWAVKNTDPFAGGHDNKALIVGNGGFGAMAENKDTQVASDSQQTTNSSVRRKQRSSENKTRRWTQRLKERWKDRQGKKGKDEEGSIGDQKSGEEPEISHPNQVTESLINASNKDERTLRSLDTSGASKMLPARTEDATNDSHIRPASDFELGLGSFSLLEEITKGQEWAKFLSPSLSSSSANQRPLEDPMGQPPNQLNPHSSTPSNGILNQLGSGGNQWSFRSTESSRATDFSMAQTLPNAFPAASTDISGGKLHQTDPSEAMEDGHNYPHMQSGASRLEQQIRPPSFVVSTKNPLNKALKSRVTLNRKRQHQSADRRDDRLQADKISDGEQTDREGDMSSLNPTSSQMMVDTGESEHENVIPLYTLNSHSASLSPTAFNPLARAPHGVLKYPVSPESESSMETVNKRRRVEENRRVRFAEEVVAIEPPDMDLDTSDLEDDSAATDEDSVTEQECEVHPVAAGEEAPARRTALPAWILALKRKNTNKKRR
ncbi:uncharacterized protein zgc:113229 [Haplochromis burtoni]|uniref:uncharacterized protein zgc:113229 n=1 Tax=Haplochromis burtoni TaxID=8153 RepID=UPI0003BD83A3|nr:uncharacterized protein zgc:113229 [Haplochromis burtoni]XP_005913487.1 uncharacterized protein zgc:113229 [Haplochromis burtoni]XP_042077630.1 uncharacterized protein zgc:113229 [Haplochromis burtoni]